MSMSRSAFRGTGQGGRGVLVSKEKKRGGEGSNGDAGLISDGRSRRRQDDDGGAAKQRRACDWQSTVERGALVSADDQGRGGGLRSSALCF